MRLLATPIQDNAEDFFVVLRTSARSIAERFLHDVVRIGRVAKPSINIRAHARRRAGMEAANAASSRRPTPRQSALTVHCAVIVAFERPMRSDSRYDSTAGTQGSQRRARENRRDRH
jgi:hypothetical protein